MRAPIPSVEFNEDLFPDELKVHDAWVVWRPERDKSGNRWTKVLYQADAPAKHASSTDPKTWSPLATAVASARAVDWGVGFVVSPSNGGVVGIDLDHVLTSAKREPDGTWSVEMIPEAARIVAAMNSYTEVTPSGDGLRILVEGEWKDTGKNQPLTPTSKIEVYAQGRFLTVTGRHVVGTPPTVEERTEQLDILHTEHFRAVSTNEAEASPVDATDAELLSIARRSKNGEKFTALFDRGDTSLHGGDESSADLALLTMLAFWTGRDRERMERLFTASALGKREKWSRADYRDRSIGAACSRVKDVFKSNSPSVEIVLSGKPTARLAEEGWAALQAANKPVRFFSREFSFVVLDQKDGIYRVAPADVDRLFYELRRAARWVHKKTVEEGGKKVEKKTASEPPLNVVRDMLAAPSNPLPNLNRVVEVPVVDQNGVVCERGYNAGSGLYYHDAVGFTFPSVSDNPDEVEVEAAKHLILDELLGEFPFESDSDKAHAVALGLLPFARDLIAGPTPLHLIKKPSPGSGATLLVDVISRVATGRDQSGMTEASGEEEWRKRLTAVLMDMPTVILIDNLREPLDSGAVASALTTMRWSDRLLGHTKTVNLPVRCAWVATANNPQLSNELARRTVPVSLDPNMDQPWLRTGFRHSNLREWTTDNRGELVWAFLTLVRRWIAAGRPRWHKKTLGSYEDWAQVVGGILETAGIPGFLDSLDSFYSDSDAEGDPWRAFVSMWWEKFGTSRVTASQLISAFWDSSTEEGPIQLPGRTAGARALAKALTKNVNRVFSAYRLTKAPPANHTVRWALKLAAPAATSHASAQEASHVA